SCRLGRCWCSIGVDGVPEGAMGTDGNIAGINGTAIIGLYAHGALAARGGDRAAIDNGMYSILGAHGRRKCMAARVTIKSIQDYRRVGKRRGRTRSAYRHRASILIGSDRICYGRVSQSKAAPCLDLI